MAAPTSSAREENPCQPGAVHTWHFSEVALFREGRIHLKSGRRASTIKPSTRGSGCYKPVSPADAIPLPHDQHINDAD